MEHKYKAILFFAVILALIGYTTGGTTNYNNYTNDSGLHVNKSGDTMTGTLKVPQIESPTGTAKYYSIYNNTGIWGYYDLIGTIIPLYRHTWSKLYTYQDWDLGDHNISNCVNCAYKSDIVSDGTKVNKSWDTMNFLNLNNTFNITSPNGQLNLYGIHATLGGTTPDIFNYTHNGTILTELSINGAQSWRIQSNTLINSTIGYILYATPGGLPGIVILNSTGGLRQNIYPNSGDGGLVLSSSDTSISNTNKVIITNQANNNTIKVTSMAGSGNAYVCVDSTGKYYRGSPTC